MSIVIVIPFLMVVSAVGYLLYVRIVRPTPVALGSVIPKVCVVSADEIREFCETSEEREKYIRRAWRDSQLPQLRVANRYIALMTWNTRLFLQVARFEELKIDPHKSSLDYDNRETLALRLAEDAVAVRWLLVKGQLALVTRTFFGEEIRGIAIQKLLDLMREYKQLEQDTVALVAMAKEECYYDMLVERLGLSGWTLLKGDAPAS